MTEIKDKSLQVFLDELASKASTPGGGSAAAIMGAQSAALTSMVCNLTIGKANYVEVEADMQALLQQSEALRERLTALVKADVEVFDQVMAAYGLPKDSDEQKTARSAAIQTALKAATDVPLDCAKACAEAITLSRIATEKGNVNLITDAGAAVMSAYAGLKTAALNVYINLGAIKDSEFSDSRRATLNVLLEGVDIRSEEIYQRVVAKL